MEVRSEYMTDSMLSKLAGIFFIVVSIGSYFMMKREDKNRNKIKPKVRTQEQPLWEQEYEREKREKQEFKKLLRDRREEKRPLFELKYQRLRREARAEQERLQLEEQERWKRYILWKEEQEKLLKEKQEKRKKYLLWKEGQEQQKRLMREEQKKLLKVLKEKRIILQREEQEKINLAIEIKEYVEYLLGNNEYRKILEGFVLKVPDFLNFQTLRTTDSYFIYSPSVGDFEQFVFCNVDELPNKYIEYHRDNNYKKYILDNESSPLGQLRAIFKSKMEFKSDNHCSRSLWGALKRVAISHFSEQFTDEYRECHYLFKDGFEDILITSHFNPEIDPNVLILLSYYLLNNDTTGTKDLFSYYEEIIEKVNAEKKERELFNYEKQLLTSNNKLSKVCTIENVDMMDGYQFEEFVYVLFSKLGYVTKITKASGDQGVDVIAEKGTMKIAIQAKCYSGSVSNSSVQQIVAGARHYNCNKKMVVTNSRFTQSAIKLAHSNNVVLWDRDLLKEKLLEAQLSVL